MGNVTSIKDGIVVNVVSVTADTRAATKAFLQANGYICVDDSTASPGDAWDGSAFSQPAVPPSAGRLTRLEFMSRFTDAELAGIYTAAKTSIAVEIWLEKFKLAQEVVKSDPATIAGLQSMEAAGLIGPGRAAEILT